MMVRVQVIIFFFLLICFLQQARMTLYTMNVIYDRQHWDLQRLWTTYKVSVSLPCLLIVVLMLPSIRTD